MEPIFLCEISMPFECLGSVYQVLGRRRGIVISEESSAGNPMYVVKAHLPVSESFGFNESLREATSGMAFPQCVFDHWEVMNGDPLESSSAAMELVENIRLRKGLKGAIPSLDNYLDKL